MSVTYELVDNVAAITFDDGKANVFGHDALLALGEALDRANDDGAGAVMIAGRPGRFSAGFDLATMTSSTEAMRALVCAGGRFISRLLVEPVPVVAGCTGHALAAGALVLLACDHRVGAEGDWKIGLNEVAIGMPLPNWAVELARYRMPPSQFDRVVLGEVGGPDQARASGFLDVVVEPDRLLDEAMGAATRFAKLRHGAVDGTKRRARGDVARRMLAGMDEDMASLSGPEGG
jgi:enoyl-CoA hydratase